MVKPSKKPTKKKKRKSPVDRFLKQTSKILNDAVKTVVKPFEPLLSKKKRSLAIKKYQTESGRIIMSSILESIQDEANEIGDNKLFHGKTIAKIIEELKAKNRGTSVQGVHTQFDNVTSSKQPEYNPIIVEKPTRYGFEDYLDLIRSD